ncbi:hypothetical protein ANACOL_00003 [Anaerotruncus colihominis DSM 17241]|uniref:Uncharacterized protein n=1 Tax=Anaerotruncus colihominis DSM 17241 TaxID=445972 RepID=B0P5I1_9FIRM|nr:hypothetical protein ANACOL_00003 [Anaerotruncus colihominis DSM 17241]
MLEIGFHKSDTPLKKLTLCIFFILYVKNNNLKIINCQSCNYKSICVINIINNRQSGTLFSCTPAC